MPPKATFASIIKTRPKNKGIHPGEVVNHDDDGIPKALPPMRKTAKEIKETRRQQELEQKTAEQKSQNAIAAVGLVEDSLREEDIARQTRPNRQLENVPAFRPPVAIEKGKKSLKTLEKDLLDQNDGARFEPIYLTLLFLTIYLPDFDNSQSKETVPIFQPPATGGSNKASHTLKDKEHRQYKGVNLNNAVLPCKTDIYPADFEIEQSATYNDSGSDSGDQFKPAEHSESEEDSEDDLQGDVEVESEDESKKKSTKVNPVTVKSKKGNLKPGRKHIIATRKTNATAGTPSITTTSIKSGAHENEGNTR
jgi:hypothetical protein